MLASVVELTVLGCVLLALLLIPVAFMLRHLRDQHVNWPAFTLVQRERVRVEQGAFRDATAEIERQIEVPSGIPTELKVLSWLSMVVGQAWPLFAFEACGLSFAACIEHRERSAMLSFLAGSLVMALWAMATRSSWKASVGVLAGDAERARLWLRRAVWMHGATAGLVAIVGAALWLTRSRGSSDPSAALLLVPFALQLSLAFLHEARFLHHEGRLAAAASAAPLDPSSGFELSNVRVQNVAQTESDAAHEAMLPGDPRSRSTKHRN